jgi:squalene cyclase
MLLGETTPTYMDTRMHMIDSLVIENNHVHGWPCQAFTITRAQITENDEHVANKVIRAHEELVNAHFNKRTNPPLFAWRESARKFSSKFYYNAVRKKWRLFMRFW